MIDKFVTDKQIAAGSLYQPLKIPRRPAWTNDMTAEEIARQESMSFLEWRRDIA
jgi:hypothetical protein